MLRRYWWTARREVPSAAISGLGRTRAAPRSWCHVRSGGGVALARPAAALSGEGPIVAFVAPSAAGAVSRHCACARAPNSCIVVHCWLSSEKLTIVKQLSFRIGHNNIPPGTMPHSYQNTWLEESYNYGDTAYEWGEPYYAAPMFKFPDEQKFTPMADVMDFEHSPLTAVGKTVPLADGLFTKREDTKPMKQYSPNEVMEWICEEARKANFEYERILLTNFCGVDGCTLLKMTEHEFLEKDEHYGHFLYQAVARHRRNEEAHQRITRDDNLISVPPFENIRQPPEHDNITLIDISKCCKPAPSDNDSYQSDLPPHEIPEKQVDNVTKTVPPFKRPVGRPPKPSRMKRGNKEKKCGRLWEFIRDLLLKPEYCPSLICWENHDEGIFRFVRSDKVADLWGKIKDNPKMTYEKLSRAMRYYYKSQVLLPVLGRRLVYKFGPTARGWRTDNPNFRDSTK